MSERGNALAAKAEKSYADLIEFLQSLNEADLTAPCEDPSGKTVGAVAGHLAEGAEQLFSWGATVLHGGGPTGAAPSGHSHDTAVLSTTTQLNDAVALFNRAGTAAISLLRFLTDEQLDSKPPAAEGISDGSATLAEVIDDLMEHQTEHVRFMRDAVAKQATARE
jgi:hypothetical protein